MSRRLILLVAALFASVSAGTASAVGGAKDLINLGGAHGEYFYRIERYNSDNIAKFRFKSPGRPLWQVSTMDAGDVESSNPHDMVFASDEKTYVLRFGSTKAWIVNPNATRHQNRRNSVKFKQGEIDLSAYADSDGVPEMHCG